MIETKARRKYKQSPAEKDYVVTFDGDCLIWPWGRETRTIEQVTRSASWLREWIEQRSGLKVAVRSIVAVPGWEVNEIYSKTLRVVKPKYLCDAIHGNGTCVLLDDDIDKIARHLDVICRDVED